MARAKIHVQSSTNVFDFKVHHPIQPLIPTVVGACTGPIAGIRQLHMDIDEPDRNQANLVAGISNWSKRLLQLDGDSMSLYHHAANNGSRFGDPIADVYALVARPNNAILVVADGCSWGPRPRQAARCAVHGCVSDLNSKLFTDSAALRTTEDIFNVMISSLNGAQRLIVQMEGTTTTLCMAVVCELSKDHGWGLCVVSIGDSPCFVWQKSTGQVLEVTLAAHEGQRRDMRDCGGCLGANVGTEPDLSNLMLCFAPLSDGDIVFLTSDGVSDNFDPITLSHGSDPVFGNTGGETGNLSKMSNKQRQELLLKNFSNVLGRVDRDTENGLNAFSLRDAIISHVMLATDEKRKYMEQFENEIAKQDLSSSNRKKLLHEMQRIAKTLPGKLDHATVAAYQVGHLSDIDC